MVASTELSENDKKLVVKWKKRFSERQDSIINREEIKPELASMKKILYYEEFERSLNRSANKEKEKFQKRMRRIAISRRAVEELLCEETGKLETLKNPWFLKK